MDVSKHILAKSNQLNADDLVAGPITVQITGVSESDSRIVVRISGGHMPWVTSKTALRVLVNAWGTESDTWVGRWVTLYRDEKVRFGGDEVGGIRIQALSHIEKALTLSLAVSKGKKQVHKVAVLKPDQAKQTGAPTANLDALLAEAGLTRVDVDRWRAAAKKEPLSTLTPEQTATFAGWLAGDAKRLEAIRALVPTDDTMSTTDGQE